MLSIEPTELLAKDRAGARYLNLPCLIVSGFHCRFVFNRPAPSGLEAKLGDCIILKPNVLKTKLPGLERYCDLRVFLPMSSDHIIVDAIKVAQNLLSQNLPPAHNLTDAATVLRFRELVRSQAIRSALERSSDTLFAFALRAVERVTSDHSQTNRETIKRLWEVLDDPHLNQALGNPHNRRQMLGPPWRH